MSRPWPPAWTEGDVHVRVIVSAPVILEVHENGNATLIVIPTAGATE